MDIIGGTKSETITGSMAHDLIYGDPFDGYDAGYPPPETLNPYEPPYPQPLDGGGEPLNSGSGGDDKINAGLGDDIVFGDAFAIAGSGKGGDDRLYGEGGIDTVHGDAYYLFDAAKGGDDRIAGAETAYGDGLVIFGGAGGHDRIEGSSDLPNHLYGDAFVLSARTKGGHDRLDGGDDQDILYGDGEAALDAVDCGHDQLTGNGGDDILYGDVLAVDGTVGCGNDRLCGGAGNDLLAGDVGTTVWSGINFLGTIDGGNDVLKGGAGDDRLWGEGGNIAGQAGHDRLDGGTGDDELIGDAWRMWGGTCGNDSLTGGAGNDDLWGDFRESLGSDPLTGADVFVFAPGCDQDTIHDFEAGQDTIDLTAFSDIDGFAGLSLGGGPDTVIDLGAATGGPANEDVLTVAGVTNLTASDFLFA
ncbi:MAG: hypothetical protein H6905_03095 [Hyphomicrobiales bacterium]|nr:hypothetical protein [Hyphomicrobiales bacterium]